MDNEYVIKNVVDLNFGDDAFVNACLLRLEKLASDMGKDGIIALRLIPILKDLLNI